jgi:hypothetical protein
VAALEKSREVDERQGPPDGWGRFFEAMAWSGLGERAVSAGSAPAGPLSVPAEKWFTQVLGFCRRCRTN